MATGVGLVALATLLAGVGLPALLPPGRVPAIEITEPAAQVVEHRQNGTAPPSAGTVHTPASGDDDDDDADDRPAPPPGGGGRTDDSPADDGGSDDDDDGGSDDDEDDDGDDDG